MYCQNCGSRVPDEVDYCIMCGQKLNKAYLNQPVPQQPVNQRPATQKPRKKIKWVISLLAIGLVGIITALVVLNKFPTSKGGNKAFAKELTKGFSVSGEENVLDKDRTFEAEPLTDEALEELAKTYPFDDRVLLEAFEFDAGMTEEEQFPGKVKLEFDLYEHSIPENLRQFVRVERISEDGTSEEIAETLEGNKLVCYTDKNCVFTLSIILGVVATAGYVVDRAESDLLTSKDYFGVDFYTTDTAVPGYSISWPTTMDFGNPKVVKETFQKLQKVYDSYKFDHDKSISDNVVKNIAYKNDGSFRENVRVFAIQMYNDPDFETAMKQFQDKKWQEENVWPAQVQYSIMALKDIDPYMYGDNAETSRRLRRPRWKTKILILNPWPYSNSDYAYVINPKTASPVLQINATSLPSQTRQFKSKSQTSIKRELYTTISHELFHMTQMGHVGIEWNSYKWFWEATATVFEEEAIDYFVKAGKFPASKEENLNTIFYDTMSSSIGLQGQWGTKDYGIFGYGDFSQKQGYTASRFLKYMRDQHYSSNKDDFLRDLLYSFAVHKEFYTTLRKTIDMTDEEFLTDFKKYCYEDTNRLKLYTEHIWSKSKDKKNNTYPFSFLIENNQYELNEKNPYTEVKTRYNPISFNIKKLELKLNDKTKAENKLVIKVKDEKIAKSEMTWRITSDGKKYSMLDGNQYKVFDKVTSGKYYIEEIHGYLPETEGAGKESSYEAFVMTAPKVPTVTKEKNSLVVDVPKSILQEKGIVTYVNISIISPDGKESTFSTKTGQIKIPIDDSGNIDSDSKLYKDLPLGDEIDYEALQRAAEILKGGAKKKYIIWVTETIETKDGNKISGPAGAQLEYTVEAEPFTGNLVGHWTGNALGVGNINVDISAGEDGHDYKILISLYEGMVFYGDDKKDGTVHVSGGTETTIIINSEKELYLVAPPVTLHKQ